MNTLKKRAPLLLALALALSLCACGGGKADPAPAGVPAETRETQEPAETPEDTPEEPPDETQDASAPAAVPEPEPEPEPEPLPAGPPTYTFENGVLTCSGGGEVNARGSGPESWVPVVQNAIFSTNRSEAMAAVEKVVVEEGITSIAYHALDHLENLKEVTLPDTLTSIGPSSFSQSGLTSIRIPDSVTEIDKGAFDGCKNLSSVTLPSGLTQIGDSMFSSCESLTSIQIPDGVTTIGSWAFSGTSLTELTLPSGLTEIGFEFIASTPITPIEIPASVENMDGALSEAFNLTEIVLHGELSLQAIEGTALKGLMQNAKQNNTGLTIYGPSGGVVEGWTNKQISESYPNCKFVAND